MLKIKYVTFLLMLFTFTSFAGTIDSTAKTVNMSDFKKELKSNNSLVVLDIRMPDELSGPLGKIDGAINIPLQELESRLNELEKYKGNRIFVISKSGIPSKLATEMLISHGYRAVNVLGGMMAYRQNN
ncbi:MAG TPA: rhodanese-like domain-containing protein [Ignavibacteriaceae bacterium]|nr:rhodanese-like domain-containing protein [Ignavibacteriaceae bacterium]